ncbi:DUF1295 domain-containing protein [Chloroflexota bacterium]
MNEQAVFNGLIAGWFVLAAVIFVALLFFVAPYGRHVRKGWGSTLRNTLGWVVMEAAAPIVFAVCYVLGGNYSWTAAVFFVMWEVHYLHRSFIYPFTLRGGNARRMPVSVAAMGLLFNGVNGYLNGRYLYTFSSGYANDWLRDPRFVIGAVIFILGYAINRRADLILRELRQSGETGYKVPSQWLYRWISCPNYLGEIMQWVGWAVATWSLAALAFAVWTAANLVPRARANHAWYHSTFDDYPAGRKALIPRVW